MSPQPTASPTRTCPDHPGAIGLYRCHACGRALCDTCFSFHLDQMPACAACGYEAATRTQRRTSLAVTFLLVGLGLSFWLYRRPKGDLHAEAVVLGVAVLVAAGAILLFWKRSGPVAELRDREIEVDSSRLEPTGASPFRARARTLAMRFVPRVSGAATAGIVGASFILAAVVLPLSFQLPHWIEAEAVLAIWWVALTATLAVLLYRGFRLKDDYVFVAFWNRTRNAGKPGRTSRGDALSGCAQNVGCDGCGSFDGEAALFAIVIAIALAAVFGVAWIVAELALPIVLFVSYAVLHRAITRVAHDRHDCRGRLAKSIGWGGLWAGIYLVPLAVVVLLIHAVAR